MGLMRTKAEYTDKRSSQRRSGGHFSWGVNVERLFLLGRSGREEGEEKEEGFVELMACR
jgi:hypothetical protein